jgi:hypothetical protein
MKVAFVFILILFLFILLVPVLAIDWGLNISNGSSFSYSKDFDYEQVNKVALWLGVNSRDRLKFLMRGSYTYTNDDPYLFDLDAFYFSGKFPVQKKRPYLFQFTIGRFRYSDFTGYIFGHRADGFALSFDFSSVSLEFYTGYTGLLFSDTSMVAMTKGDSTEQDDDDYYLAPSRLVEVLKLKFPEIFLRQSLVFSLIAQQDLRYSGIISEGETTESETRGGRLHSFYTGLLLTGPFYTGLFYDIFFCLGTGITMGYIDDAYENKANVSYLFGASLRFYSERALYSGLVFRFLFSSGDKDYETYFREGNTKGLSTMFVPVSQAPLALIFLPQLGNLFLFQLSYSFKPFGNTGKRAIENFQLSLKDTMFFRPTKGLIDADSLNTDSDSLYVGNELDFIINYRPISDFGMGFSFGFFFPNRSSSGVFDRDERKFEFLARITASLSF